MNNDFNNNQQGFGGGLSYQGPQAPQQPMMNQGMDVGMQQPMMNQGMDVGMQQPVMNQGMDMGMQQPMANQGMDVGMQQPVMNQGMDMGMQQSMAGQGLSYQGPQAPQQPMMNQSMNMGMQQPMMQQNIQQPMQPTQQPAGINAGGKNAFGNMNKLIPIIGVGAVAFVLIVVLFFNVVLTKTYKCEESDEFNGVEMEMVTKAKFRFGTKISEYSKVVYTFTDDYEGDEDIDDFVKEMKKLAKSSCKEKDGCKYSIKNSKKKVTLVSKQKYDKDAREDFKEYIEDNYDDFKEYYENLKDSCDE